MCLHATILKVVDIKMLPVDVVAISWRKLWHIFIPAIFAIA
jgi:hypothetical protein